LYPFLNRRFWLLSILLLGTISCTASESVDFTLPDLDGNQRSLSEFRGKWVVVNYWATWCPPCREEMPELEVFHNAHKDVDAVVLGVNMESVSTERLRQFLEEQFISFPVWRDTPRPRTELGSIPGLPTSYMVSPEGEPVARQVGPLTRQQLEDFIERFKSGESAAGG
jgi:peroxiredoxin